MAATGDESTPAEGRDQRHERTAAAILGVFSASVVGLVALTLLALAFAPNDESALGLAKAAVFRCH